MNKNFLLYILVGLIAVGCAEIQPPSPGEVIQHPFGNGPLRIGMTKNEVKGIWGEPDQVTPLGKDQWSAIKEQWVYKARYPGVPADLGYVSKDKTLEFDGDNLVSFN